MAWTTSNRAQRLPGNWKTIREAILDRDGHQCRWIMPDGTRCPNPATDVDHITAKTDIHTAAALQSLCRPHHQHKSAREGAAARAEKRKRLHLPTAPHPGMR